MKYQAGDIILVRSYNFFSPLIRLFTRSIGEPPTKVNHVALITGARTDDAGTEHAGVIEANATGVSFKSIHEMPWTKEKVAIYRNKTLAPYESERLGIHAFTYQFKKYGFLKVTAHFLDWFLNGAYVFRRLVGSDRYPICSWLVAHVYDKVGIRFGVHPNAASPDDIWDYVKSHPGEWECVRPYSPWKEKS